MSPIANGPNLYDENPLAYRFRPTSRVYVAQTNDLETVPLNVGFLLKTIVLSNEPYLRLCIHSPDVDDFVRAFCELYVIVTCTYDLSYYSRLDNYICYWPCSS